MRHTKSFDFFTFQCFFLPRLCLIILTWMLMPSCSNAQQSGNSPGIHQIRIRLDGRPEKVGVQKTPLRYNKRFAMSFHTDDGFADVYHIGFKFFTGKDGSPFPGLFFTDGCGNELPFRLSAALFSFSAWNNEDMHQLQNNYNTVSWDQLASMYRHGCGIYNHGFTSDAPTTPEEISYSIRRNESYIRRSLATEDVRTRILVNPNGLQEFSPVAFRLGYRYAFRMGAWTIIPETGINVNAFQAWDKPLELNRVLAETVDVKQLADNLARKSVHGANYWMPVFTHRIIEDYPLDDFYNDWSYIAKTYGKQGSDDIWMASEEEILNYLLVRQRVEITHEVQGNMLIISLQGDLPPDLRFYPLSLLVETPGVTIAGVETVGAGQLAHSLPGKSDMLINLSWEGNKEPSIGQRAVLEVERVEKTRSPYDALVAMDYVLALPDGKMKDKLRKRLCAIEGPVFEKGFCPEN
ncbi:MAG: hypothetical protein IPM52_10660 [Bacteroidetes bacterium]|nr:hypothetical protein [Bacteroidota bacterium]